MPAEPEPEEEVDPSVAAALDAMSAGEEEEETAEGEE
jgi:hypothetical protein